MMVWRAILLIYADLDVQLLVAPGQEVHCKVCLSETELSEGILSFEHFPQLVHSLTSGRATVLYRIHRARRPLNTLSPTEEYRYWPSPEDVRPEIDRWAPPGSCESIFALWPQRDLASGDLIPCAGWGLGMAASPWSNHCTYAVVGNAPTAVWQVPMLGEVWLHEWLHGVCAYFANLGYRMPHRDADGGGCHGYVQSPTSGWTDYYRDLMNGNVREGGISTGIPSHAWKWDRVTS